MRGRPVAGVLLGLVAATAAGISAARPGCRSFGAHAGGERLARMERSPDWRDGEFRNPQPMWNDMHLALAHGFSGVPGNEPSAPVPVARTDPAVLAHAPATGLRVTWFGPRRRCWRSMACACSSIRSGATAPRPSNGSARAAGTRRRSRSRVTCPGGSTSRSSRPASTTRPGPTGTGDEQAVLSARRVRANALVPVRWGLFPLAPRGRAEPAERVLTEDRCAGQPMIAPRPGRTIEPTALRPGDSPRWWPHAHWSDAAQTPIVATVVGVDAYRVALPACPAGSTAQAASER